MEPFTLLIARQAPASLALCLAVPIAVGVALMFAGLLRSGVCGNKHQKPGKGRLLGIGIAIALYSTIISIIVCLLWVFWT